MLKWIADNWLTVVVVLIVLGAVGGVIAAMVRDKKKGRSSCGCGCANCPMSGSCHKAKK